MARGKHLFPCRTQQLSLVAVTILGVHPWENSTVPNYIKVLRIGGLLFFDQFFAVFLFPLADLSTCRAPALRSGARFALIISTMKRHSWLAGSLIVLVLVTVIGTARAFSDVSSSFTLGSGVTAVPGNLVSTEGSPGTVVLSDVSNGARLAGVVVPPSESLLAFGATGQHSVQTATWGIVAAFVSTIGGDIHAGDAISVSPLSGIGMKAASSLRVAGIAQADFSASSTGAKAYQVKDKTGRTQDVFVGSIPIMLNITTGAATGGDRGVLNNLQATATGLVGHPVSVMQALLSFLVAVVAIASVIALVYGSIRGGIIAVGRNPLARAAIYKSLAQVIAMACLIVAVAAVVLYFTLR